MSVGLWRRVTESIKPELRRRSAVESSAISKSDYRMGRNFLDHARGNAINAVLAAAGYNFRRLLAWLVLLCAFLLAAFAGAPPSENHAVAA
jgi:IS5 family transposase